MIFSKQANISRLPPRRRRRDGASCLEAVYGAIDYPAPWGPRPAAIYERKTSIGMKLIDLNCSEESAAPPSDAWV